VQFASGAIAAGCHHNGCAGNDWEALRRLYEPGWTPYQDRANAPQDHHAGLSSYFPRKDGEPESPYKTTNNIHTSSTSLTSYPWPTLSEEAYYGLAGDYVRTIAEHSEADPAALLAQFLTVFGIASGHQRYYLVEATRHYPNIFCAIVGKTSRARKGTSYAHIEAQMHSADETWSLNNHIKGCGSGEGLIFAVRDARTSREAIKEKGKVIGYEDVEVDAGVRDKRALFQTGEFSSILKVCAREGNTLSEVIRDSWDTGYLRNATKNNPLTATDAHIGIIGHVTITEVQRLLTSTDAANGFANRFIWICAQRSQCLPDGGAIASVDFRKLVSRLRAALTFAKQPGPMQRDAQAKAAWHAVYDMLSEDRTGLANTLLARAEAQVLRLSMLYALLEGSAVIKHKHLNAALALWHYAEESAAYIFGEATGDETADTIVAALTKAGGEGCTKNTLLETIFQRNTPAGEVERALHLLEQQERIACTKRPPAGGKGRHAQVYTLLSNEVNEGNEVKPNRYLIASNDAVKSMSLSADAVGKNYEENTPACEKSEESPLPQLPVTDCYPPPCPHTETRIETMLDGSQLVRCVACQRPVSITPNERS
jgi:hypothetical protein